MEYNYEYDGLKIYIRSTWVPGECRDYRRASITIRGKTDYTFSTTIIGKDIVTTRKIFFNLIPISSWRHETDDEFIERILKESIADYRVSSTIRKLPHGFEFEKGKNEINV